MPYSLTFVLRASEKALKELTVTDVFLYSQKYEKIAVAR